jgi:two-component system sensor histidine kinase UhpB
VLHHRFPRPLAALVLAVLLAAIAGLTATVSAQGRSAPLATVVIDRALAVPVAGTRATGTPGLVDLPDTWALTRPSYEGGVVYQATFQLATGTVPDELLGIYVERACTQLRIELNDALVWAGGRSAEPVTRDCAQPLVVTLPPALLKAQNNVLSFRLQGHALERVATVRDAAGLSQIELGPLAELVARRAAVTLWSASWVQASALLLTGLGCVLLAVGWLNPREVYFNHFGWLALAWAGVSTLAFARNLPWSNEATQFLLASAWAVLLALTAQFLLTFAQLRSRAIEIVVATQWVLLPLTLLLAGPEHLRLVANAWYVVLGLELIGVASIYLVTVRRLRPQDFGPMALVLAAGALLLAHEYGAQWQLLPAGGVSLAQILAPFLLLGVGARLFLMFAQALKRAEDDRTRLRGELATATADFDARLERTTAQRVELFTERERKRIAGDLHDDLGAKLLTIVHNADAEKTPELAREALEEMRLSVRGLAGKPVALADAVADWRAEVLTRLEQAGVRGTWEPGNTIGNQVLPARTFMQLTRILREAVSNVIKHSKAGACEVRCDVVDGNIDLAIRDDGQGIAGDEHKGQGLWSMKRRAKKLHGQCLVESRPGSGVLVTLHVPL